MHVETKPISNGTGAGTAVNRRQRAVYHTTHRSGIGGVEVTHDPFLAAVVARNSTHGEQPSSNQGGRDTREERRDPFFPDNRKKGIRRALVTWLFTHHYQTAICLHSDFDEI